MARLRGRATPVRCTVAPPAHHHDWRLSDKVTFMVRVHCSNWTRISRVRAEIIAHAQQVTIVSTKVARDRLLRLLALEAAGSQSVVSGESGQLEVAMAAIWYVPRPRLVAWGSCDDLSFASIDLTVHRGGLVVGAGGRPRVAWAPLPRLPTHTAPGRTHVRSAPDRREVGGAPLVRLARLGPRAVFLRDLEQPSAGYHAGRLRRSHCQGSRFTISPTSGPKRNMCASSAKLSICNRRVALSLPCDPVTAL